MMITKEYITIIGVKGVEEIFKNATFYSAEDLKEVYKISKELFGEYFEKEEDK